MRAHRILRVSLVGALLALFTGACGGQAASDSKPEKQKIQVRVLRVIDTAPFFLARKNGFFADEGLTVDPVSIKDVTKALPKLRSGDIDVTFGNYVTFFRSYANGNRLHIAAEGYNAESGVLSVMAIPGSGLREPEDLAGKTIAVNNVKHIGTLTVKSVLRTHDVDLDSVDFVDVPFTEMDTALVDGSVDAAWMVEPFISVAKQKLGAHRVLDAASGATKGFPIAGYATTQKFYEKNPKTVAAFQRALQRAQRLAHDRAKVERILPQYTEINKQTAALVTIGKYPTTVDARRLQRVADAMRRFGILEERLDVRKLIG